MIARSIFYFALLILLPLPFMVTADTVLAEIGRIYYALFSLPIAMVLPELLSVIMAIRSCSERRVSQIYSENKIFNPSATTKSSNSVVEPP